MRDFLTAHHVEQCLYLDSDIMLYADVTKDRKKFDRFDFTLCWNTMGCVFFLMRRDGLEGFCRFLMDIYNKKDRYHYDKMLAHFAVRRKNRLTGGACDMTAFQLYSEANFGQVGEASHIVDGSVYDPNINRPQPGFEIDRRNQENHLEGRTALRKRYARTGEEIRFNSLHFQGKAKQLMGRFYTGRPV